MLTGGILTKIATTAFVLQWTHSVERIDWRERWQVEPAGLYLIEASIKGSGAGMEPGDDAVFADGWWTWQPRVPRLKQLFLGASGATVGGWHLCYAGKCKELGVRPGEDVTLTSCPI